MTAAKQSFTRLGRQILYRRMSGASLADIMAGWSDRTDAAPSIARILRDLPWRGRAKAAA